jgi:putative tryptophan/tyrosine transport system substrate-binding protein
MSKRDLMTASRCIGKSTVALFLIAVATASPEAPAQRAPIKGWTVGILWHAANLEGEMVMYQPFADGMRALGYVEGHNVNFDHTFVDEKYERFPANAQQLIDRKVDIIMASVPDAAKTAAELTKTIPIVFATSGDPIKTGLVASIRQPGGNVTGFSLFSPELTTKHLEMLHEIVPGLSSAAILWNPGNQDHPDTLKRAEQAAKQLNIKIVPISAKGPEEFSDAFSEMKKSKVNGLVVLGDAMFRVNRASIIALAAETRLPAVYAPRDYAESGGLISYGACIPCNFRRTATYIDKILKGAKPGDLPVEQPATFEMVVNLKTAAALGLTIPATLLLVADQVIE